MCRKTMNGGILLPQLSQHAGGLRRALLRSHSPMVCAACWRLPGVVALRCWHSASAKLVHGNGGLLWRKTLRQGAELGHLVRLVCRVCCCMARGALLFRPLQMQSFSHTQLFQVGSVAELRVFKLERLAQRLSRYALLSFFVQVFAVTVRVAVFGINSKSAKSTDA